MGKREAPAGGASAEIRLPVLMWRVIDARLFRFEEGPFFVMRKMPRFDRGMKKGDTPWGIAFSVVIARDLLKILESLGEASGVGLFRFGQCFEPFCDLAESFFPGDLGKTGIHLGIFVGFPGNG